jgi:hypothetical protein
MFEISPQGRNDKNLLFGQLLYSYVNWDIEFFISIKKNTFDV